MEKKLFCYLANSGAVTAGNNVNQPIQFDNETNFEIREIRTLGTAMTITLKTSSGYLFQNNAFTSSVIGSGNNSLKLIPDTMQVPKNSNWIVNFNNATGGSLTDEIQIWGYKY